MRSRAAQLIDDHFRVGSTDDLIDWETCNSDPFAEVSLVAPVFVWEVTADRPLTRVRLS